MPKRKPKCDSAAARHRRVIHPGRCAAAALAAALLGVAGPLGATVAEDPEQLTDLAKQYEDGEGVEQDWQTARELYEQAIEVGGSEALWRLGRLLAFDRDDPFDDPDQGRELLVRGAEAGESRAAYDLATMYFHGRGVEQDRARAAKWAERAADAIPQARMMLADLYHAGDGVEQDRAAAREWAERAAMAGLADALLMAGRMQLLGIGGAADTETALANLQRAHEQGHERATRMLATALSDGRHVEPDFARARDVLESAARKGDPSVQIALARWLVTWNPDGPELRRAWFWVQTARPYRGEFDSGWDNLWNELDTALRERLPEDERAEVREQAEQWQPGEGFPGS